ncbi:MAG: hypothetical protein MRY81_10180 [Donghicola eburneus]|nr:hypothetical protein [Donghicola eburneus]MCI5040039.1 hypothetical protein [Donghicola eburneus]
MGRRTDYAQRPGYGLQEHNANVILEQIMKRTRFTAVLRDELAKALEEVANGKRLVAKK